MPDADSAGIDATNSKPELEPKAKPTPTPKTAEPVSPVSPRRAQSGITVSIPTTLDSDSSSGVTSEEGDVGRDIELDQLVDANSQDESDSADSVSHGGDVESDADSDEDDGFDPDEMRVNISASKRQTQGSGGHSSSSGPSSDQRADSPMASLNWQRLFGRPLGSSGVSNRTAAKKKQAKAIALANAKQNADQDKAGKDKTDKDDTGTDKTGTNLDTQIAVQDLQAKIATLEAAKKVAGKEKADR